LLRRDPAVEVVGLLTTINQQFQRIAIHGVREALLEEQATAAGLPLWKVPLPWPCSNDAYEAAMRTACERAVREGIEGFAFGDLFLEDIRAYRVEKLAGTGLEPIFPCWLLPTAELAREMISAGFRANLTCVDPRHLEPRFAGRAFDEALLNELPASVDPCGERGEFHTFVSAGPVFSRSIEVRPGEIVERDGFVYADFLPGSAPVSR
jgi:diphthamide synthase (EF-2-diphthine--ammonia ligase)